MFLQTVWWTISYPAALARAQRDSKIADSFRLKEFRQDVSAPLGLFLEWPRSSGRPASIYSRRSAFIYVSACACVRALTYFVFVVDGGDAKGASEHASASPGQEEDRFPGYRLCRQTGS